MQVYMLLATIITIRGRKTLTWLHYVDTVCKYSKAANAILFYRENLILLIFFCLLCILHFLLLQQPEYQGKTNIQYYRGNNLGNDIRADPRLTWFVCFYTVWAPPCNDFSPVFVDLSLRFGDLKSFKFVKFDIGKYPLEAEKYKIDISTLSKQLPTVILFQNGQETKRRPQIDPLNRKVLEKCLLTSDYLINEFQLAEVYQNCKLAEQMKKK